MKVLAFDTESRVCRIELTRRNLEVLLAKLDDPKSERTLGKRTEEVGAIWVTAVENDTHYADRSPGPMQVLGHTTECPCGPGHVDCPACDCGGRVIV